MAVSFTALTTGSDTTNQTTAYTTASITPSANQPVLVAVLTTVGSGSTPTASVSGCGLTWTLVDNTTIGSRTAWLFLGIGASPTTGALSIAGDGTTTTTSCLWQVTQCAGVDTATANGVVQSVNARPASANSVSVAFNNAVVGANGAFGVVGNSVQESPVAGTGWTAAGSTNQSAPTSGLLGEFDATASQNITASWTTASTSFVVGAELKAATGGATVTGTVTAAGVGAASVTGALTVPGTLTAAGAGTATVTGAAGAVLTANGTGSASVTGSKTDVATVAATGAGGASVTGSKTGIGAVTAAGAGSMSLSATTTPRSGGPSNAPVITFDPYRSSFALWYTVDASYNGSAVSGATGMQPVGGTITDTTRPGVRRTLSLDLAPEPGMFDKLAPIGTRLTVTAHVRGTSRTVTDIPMGVFDVDSQTLTEGGGKLSLTAPDKWQRIVRAKFLAPTASTPGIPVTQQIVNLIQGALGASETVTVTATSTATMGAQTWDSDRAQAIIDLANGIGAWVYFDRNGVATVANIPTVQRSAKWLIDASVSGVLVSLDRTRDRTHTYNVVVVSSSAASGEAFAAQTVWDSDPNSPTYAGTNPATNPGSAGPFGIVPYHFDTPLLMDASAARQTGLSILYKTAGLASQVTLGAVPNPSIDAFDSLDVLPPRERYDIARVVERHIADTVTHQLDVTQPLHIDGRSTRTDPYT
ncbi:MAG: hypothetical protein ACXV3F_00350 [Frankiaceae bacterium]